MTPLHWVIRSRHLNEHNTFVITCLRVQKKCCNFWRTLHNGPSNLPTSYEPNQPTN